MNRIWLLVICGALAVLCACGDGGKAAVSPEGDTLVFRHAERISMVRHDGYTEVTLRNPWKAGKVLHRYVLVPRDAELPQPLPEGTLVRTPLRRAAVFTRRACPPSTNRTATEHCRRGRFEVHQDSLDTARGGPRTHCGLWRRTEPDGRKDH